MACAKRLRWDVDAEAAIGGGIAFEKYIAGQHELWKPMQPWPEVPIRVDVEQGHVEDVQVVQLDPEVRGRLRLHVLPGADVADVVARDAGRARGAELQVVEHLSGLHRL